MKIETKDTRERKVTANIPWTELREMLVQRVLAEAKIDMDRNSYLATVKLQQETEGSPSYTVDKWSVTVTVVHDLPEARVQ